MQSAAYSSVPDTLVMNLTIFLLIALRSLDCFAMNHLCCSFEDVPTPAPPLCLTPLRQTTTVARGSLCGIFSALRLVGRRCDFCQQHMLSRRFDASARPAGENTLADTFYRAVEGVVVGREFVDV